DHGLRWAVRPQEWSVDHGDVRGRHVPEPERVGPEAGREDVRRAGQAQAVETEKGDGSIIFSFCESGNDQEKCSRPLFSRRRFMLPARVSRGAILAAVAAVVLGGALLKGQGRPVDSAQGGPSRVEGRAQPAAGAQGEPGRGRGQAALPPLFFKESWKRPPY